MNDPAEVNDTAAFRRALWFGLAVSAAVAVIGSIVGGLTAGPDGVWSALIGAALAAFFTSMSAGTVLLGVRLTREDPANPLFYGIVLGGWVAKFAVFILAMVLLRDQPFVQPQVLLVCVLAAVVLSVGADVVAVLGTRQSYVDTVRAAEDRRAAERPAPEA